MKGSGPRTGARVLCPGTARPVTFRWGFLGRRRLWSIPRKTHEAGAHAAGTQLGGVRMLGEQSPGGGGGAAGGGGDRPGRAPHPPRASQPSAKVRVPTPAARARRKVRVLRPPRLPAQVRARRARKGQPWKRATHAELCARWRDPRRARTDAQPGSPASKQPPPPGPDRWRSASQQQGAQHYQPA